MERDEDLRGQDELLDDPYTAKISKLEKTLQARRGGRIAADMVQAASRSVLWAFRRESRWRRWHVVNTEVYHNPQRVAIDRSHFCYLCVSLQYVILVDTHGVHPDEPMPSPGTKILEHKPAVLGLHCDIPEFTDINKPIASVVVVFSSPGVGYSLVIRTVIVFVALERYMNRIAALLRRGYVRQPELS